MHDKLEALVDVMRVPVDGDPTVAVVRVDEPARGARRSHATCWSSAAAPAASRRRWPRRGAGSRVHLLEETDWLGGQLTAQGVSALDEHEHIETFGGTASYYALRNALRDHYRPLAGEAGRQPHFNPGNCWVTRVAFEPRVAVADDAGTAAAAYRWRARCTLHLRTKIAAVGCRGRSHRGRCGARSR